MLGKLIILSISGMSDNSEYDVIGELFRRKLEYHQLPVDDDGWDEVKRRMDKGRKKAVIWMWRIGAVAAAASIAAILVFKQPTTVQTEVMTVAQQEMETPTQVYIAESSVKSAQNNANTIFQPLNDSVTQSLSHSVIQLLNYSVTQLLSHTMIQLLSCSDVQSHRNLVI